tara:strand:+ start:3679 stop:4395 length:717 start_codon:yes stop_codon:yes gene_type:complete
MKKKKILVCGKGKWGKKVIFELKKVSNITRILDSKTKYKNINLSNIDWVFILSPNNTHYKLVNFFLNKKMNVFCEKPLCLTLKQTVFLINKARKNKCKLYISDIENYKQKKINRSNFFNITRKKLVTDKDKEILNRLTYHDIYLLKNFLEPLNKLKIIQKKKKFSLEILMKKKNMQFFFSYDINSNIKKHTINNVNFRKFRGNPLNKMIVKVLNNKVNFYKNQNTALFCNKIIKKLKK